MPGPRIPSGFDFIVCRLDCEVLISGFVRLAAPRKSLRHQRSCQRIFAHALRRSSSNVINFLKERQIFLCAFSLSQRRVRNPRIEGLIAGSQTAKTPSCPFVQSVAAQVFQNSPCHIPQWSTDATAREAGKEAQNLYLDIFTKPVMQE